MAPNASLTQVERVVDALFDALIMAVDQLISSDVDIDVVAVHDVTIDRLEAKLSCLKRADPRAAHGAADHKPRNTAQQASRSHQFEVAKRMRELKSRIIDSAKPQERMKEALREIYEHFKPGNLSHLDDSMIEQTLDRLMNEAEALEIAYKAFEAELDTVMDEELEQLDSRSVILFHAAVEIKELLHDLQWRNMTDAKCHTSLWIEYGPLLEEHGWILLPAASDAEHVRKMLEVLDIQIVQLGTPGSYVDRESKHHLMKGRKFELRARFETFLKHQVQSLAKFSYRWSSRAPHPKKQALLTSTLIEYPQQASVGLPTNRALRNLRAMTLGRRFGGDGAVQGTSSAVGSPGTDEAAPTPEQHKENIRRMLEQKTA